MSCTRVRIQYAQRCGHAQRCGCKQTNVGLVLELELSKWYVRLFDGPHCVEYSTWMRWPTIQALYTSHTRMERPTSMRCTQWRSPCSAHHSTYLREIRLAVLWCLPRGMVAYQLRRSAEPLRAMQPYSAESRSHRTGRFVHSGRCVPVITLSECRCRLSCCHRWRVMDSFRSANMCGSPQLPHSMSRLGSDVEVYANVLVAEDF